MIQRWVHIWNSIFYLLLATVTVVALLRQTVTSRDLLFIVGAGVLLSVWYWFFILRLERWGRNSARVALSFIAVILLLAGMTSVNDVYAMLFFSLYGIFFSVLDVRLAIPVVIVHSTVGALIFIVGNNMTLSEAGGVVLGFAIATVAGILMGLYITAIFRQSHERELMIEELRSTRAELASAERQAGVLEERQRLAREIHDTLAQGLISIVMHLEAAEQSLPLRHDLDAPRHYLDQARSTARESLTEARRFVWALHTEPVDYASLPDALRQAAERWIGDHGMPAASGTVARVEVVGEVRALPSHYEVTLLRAAHEALANVRRHADAKAVILTLTYMEDQISLDVQDDGQGFAIGQPPDAGIDSGSGFGLIGMRGRVETLGGSLLIESTPGEGTTLVISLPISHEVG